MNNCRLLVPVFPGNDGVLIPVNPEFRTAGNPGRPGNGSPGMKTLTATECSKSKPVAAASDGRAWAMQMLLT